jgi:hypothetical protein
MLEMLSAALAVLSSVTVSLPQFVSAGQLANAMLVGVRVALAPDAAGLMVNARVALPVPPALVALRVTVDVPEALGVPEIKPEVALTVKPAGKPVAPKLVGEFDAVI